MTRDRARTSHTGALVAALRYRWPVIVMLFAVGWVALHVIDWLVG